MKRNSIRVAALLLCFGATSCPSSEVQPSETSQKQQADSAHQPAPSANQIRENALRTAPQQVQDQVQRLRFQSADNRRKVQAAIDNK